MSADEEILNKIKNETKLCEIKPGDIPNVDSLFQIDTNKKHYDDSDSDEEGMRSKVDDLSPLITAIRSADLSSIDNLLASGADLLLIDPKTGNSAFHEAILILNKWATVSRQDVFTHLMSHLQDSNLANPINGDTLLIMAVQCKHDKAVNLLLNTKVDINKANKLGITPLMTAVDYAHLEILDFLLEKGADVDLKDFRGKTALDHTSSILEKYRQPIFPIFEKHKKN